MNRFLDYLIPIALGAEVMFIGRRQEWDLFGIVVIAFCAGWIYRTIVDYYDWKEGQE